MTKRRTPTRKTTDKKRTYKRRTPKKTLFTSKKKTRRRRKKSSKISLSAILFFILLVGLGALFFYTFVVFPKTLSNKVKKDLVTIYKPVQFEDTGNVSILKLSARPDYFTQVKAYESIKQNYGLELSFEKINSEVDKGINRINFLRNKKPYEDISPIYIYWGKAETIEISKRIKVQKKSYALIEDKRRRQKQEKLTSPVSTRFKYNNYKEKYIPPSKTKIAIVIDDVGYSYNSTYDFLTLGFPVTFAVIPDMPESKKFYNLFNEYGYDTMLHIPMEPLKGKKFVESNAIFTDMSDADIRERVRCFINKYPNVIGANNHMGSKIVADGRVMNIVLDELSKKNKFWLDSMTNINTISKEIASVHDLSYYERDVFFDNDRDRASIRKSMESLIKEAKQKGYGVGIGHIQSKELVPVLKEYYERRDELGIEFVPLYMVN